MYLTLNLKKTTVNRSDQSTYFGYTLRKQGSSFILRRKQRNQAAEWFKEWNARALSAADGQLHILEDGILSKKDLTILFENEDMKQYFPVESVSDINTYSDMIYSSGFFDLMNRKRITVHLFNKYGSSIGIFIPEQVTGNASYLLKQAAVYNDTAARLKYAKAIELAIMKNIVAQLRYYRRHIENPEIKEAVEAIQELIKRIKKSSSVDELLLLEARGRSQYYRCIPAIIGKSEFSFMGRRRRPPGDEINAMMSFGNSFLYDRISSMISRSNLDNRISFLHSSLRRRNNLCLDLADIYKPFIVDSVIFTLVNKRMISPEDCFDYPEDGVYLNQKGIALFLKELKDKLTSRINSEGQMLSYFAIIRRDLQRLKKSLEENGDFAPFVRNG